MIEEVLNFHVNLSKKYYPLIIVLAFIVAGFALSEAKETKISTNYHGFFFEDTPGLKETKLFESDFVGTREAQILIEVDRDYVDDVLEEGVLEMTGDVVDMVSTVPGVFSVSSVLDLGETRGEILSSPLEAQQKFLDKELRYSLVKVKIDSTEMPKNKVLVESLRSAVGKVEQLKGAQVTVAGAVSSQYMWNEAIRNGLASSVVVSAIMITLMLLIVFRSPTTALVIMIPVGIAVLTAFGLMHRINIPINFLTALFGSITLGIGVDNSVHIIHRYYEEQRNGNKNALNVAFTKMGRNTVFTSITTMAAFSSMLFSGFRMVAEYGIMSFIAISFALFSVLFFLPSFLLLETRIGRKEIDFSWINNVLGTKEILRRTVTRSTSYAVEKPFLVVLIILLALFPMVYGISIIRPQSDMDMWMPRNEPATRANDIISDEFWDTDFTVVLVSADDVREKTVIEAMDDITRELRGLPYARKVSSITDYITLAGYEKRDINAISPEIQRQFLTPDFTEAIIILETDTDIDAGMVNEVDDLIEYASGPSNAEIRQVGASMMLSQIEATMKKGQTTTTLASLIFVTFFLFIALRGLSGILLGLTPILMAILFALGTMGLVGIPSTPLTILLATIMLGLGIDYSIHFLARYREELGRGKTSRDAVLTSSETVGESIAITSITTMFGFLSLTTMTLIPVKEFGIITAIGLFYAAVFVPVLISTGITIRDKLYLKIWPAAGSDMPQNSP